MNPFNPFSQTRPTTLRAVRQRFAGLRTRYRDAAVSWIALGALLAAWHVETRLDPADTNPDIDPRLAGAKPALPGSDLPIRVVRADSRTWMEGGPRGLRMR